MYIKRIRITFSAERVLPLIGENKILPYRIVGDKWCTCEIRSHIVQQSLSHISFISCPLEKTSRADLEDKRDKLKPAI
ncbi:hypothetical protein MPTK1_1g13660 [Marchantia polymorpha subsp. ruderalis]|uniref:Uncharacterized protein n=2 Tax=Marchantia polymorpha TaxID=3197 RepID=A0AAF6APT1_MARPO|nr:hypothetical protein MARPO_0019s0136 [Marchantia polymorpha]BBM98451.1 hypothetical protein Mp_1g13660 [Marchantia polymorpha subsp. ruderalis]|eukprot:PTQ44722.1 hypothetical protein MARPO_0019s0136 [Marchantia polymorpha]